MTCKCAPIRIGLGPPVAYDWRDGCPIHGIGTDWYESEGKAHLMETRRKAVEAQQQAREARRRARE